MKDLDGTLRHWQRVRDLVRGLPDNQEGNHLRLLACQRILNVGGFRLGLSEAAVEELYEEGSKLAADGGDAALLVQLRMAYASRLVGLGRVREYYELSTQNLEVADASGVAEIRAGVRIGLAYALYQLGHLADAKTCVEQALEITGNDIELGRKAVGFSYRVWFVGVHAMLVGSMGSLEDGRRELVHALRLARDSGIPENLGWALGSLPVLADQSGDLAFDDLGDAKAAALEGLRIAEDLGSSFSRAVAYANISIAHQAAGEYAEAERLLKDALEMERTGRIGLEHEALQLAHLARAQLCEGRAGDARRTAEESVARAQERGQKYAELHAQIALADALCAEQGTRARAAIERALQQATTLVEETGARTQAPRISEVRARLAQCSGDNTAREQFLREAHRGYAAMGAGGHAARLSKEAGR
jgi:tetratricopeptide (TPR) repeat protein